MHAHKVPSKSKRQMETGCGKCTMHRVASFNLFGMSWAAHRPFAIRPSSFQFCLRAPTRRVSVPETRACAIGLMVLCGIFGHGDCTAVRSPSLSTAAGRRTGPATGFLGRETQEHVQVRGDQLMKADRDSGLCNSCPCCAIELDLELAVAEQGGPGRIGPRSLRGGSGDGIAASHDNEGGRIEMIVGPMFAGKSTELMRRIRRHKLAYRRCVVIKYAKDQRHGENATELSTHDNLRIKAVPCTKLYDAWNEARNSDVIGIDEAQFYPDLIQFCDEMADAGKIIILGALDGDFRREPFGSVLQLAPRAESVTKLSAVCRICGREAAFTRRLTSETALEAIGGAEMYMPTCRKCFTIDLPAQSLRVRQ